MVQTINTDEEDPRNRLYECSHYLCRKHYLILESVQRHIMTEHGGRGSCTKVPIAAAEFD